MYNIRYKSHHDANRGLKEAFSSNESAYEYLSKTLTKNSSNQRVLYIHVPYCKKICSFCPFTKFSRVPKNSYDDFIIRDIDKLVDYPFIKNSPFQAINFGGGTPTALLPEQLDKVLKYIKRNLGFVSDAEISLESSITELSDEMLEVMVENNVNRLSIGIQTFNDTGRKLLNRRGSGEFAFDRLKIIKKYIPNTNIDLIYNYPGQNEKILKQDIDAIRSLDLAGLSFYSLMIHDNTPLKKTLDKSDMKQMLDLDRERIFFNTIIDELKKDDYEMFELTKLVKNKRDRYRYIEIKHDNGDCIPIGVRAGGNIGRYIHFNPEGRSDFDEAIRISNRGRMVTEDYMKANRIVNEFQHGFISIETLAKVNNLHVNGHFLDLLDRLVEERLVVREKDIIRFTNDGYFFGNNIINEISKIIINEKLMVK